MTGRLEGKVAVITGAGSGMGRAGVIRFAEEGARVVAADVNLESAQETVALVTDKGGDAYAVAADVSNTADVEALFTATAAQYGVADILYNNAGIGPTEDCELHLLPEDLYQRVMDINVKGMFLCSKYAITAMLEHGVRGSIVNTGSVAGLKGNSTVPATAYTISKAGVIGVTKQIAATYAKHGIRCNAMCPGPIETAILAPWFEQPGTRERFDAMIPIGRIGQPEDVANLALFLASDESSFITGELIAIDGGVMAV
jgi:NAD(P)-dependent dehydrogenase (short-subunit alcohol dehydrogenase family)